MKISDLLDLIEDDSVPIREKDIIASERIMEVTMAKIHAENEANPFMRKKVRKSTTFVIIAAVILALSVTALAAGLFNHVARWDGTQWEETMATPMPTTAPETPSAEEPELEAMDEVLAKSQGRELVIAKCGSNAGSNERIEVLTSMNQLKELLTADRSPFTIPVCVPEGYAFSRGAVAYELAAEYSYTLKSSEMQDNGLVVERYTAPEEGDFISAYTLVFVNSTGDELVLSGRMSENSESAGFGYSDGDNVRKVDMEEMDNALVIEYPEYTALFMRKALNNSISYIFPLGMIREDDDPVNEFDGIIYRITSTTLDGEAICALLAP